VYRKEAEVKKPKAKPAGASAAEGGAEGDVAGEKDEGDGDEVCTCLKVLCALSLFVFVLNYLC
jgi:hypothetical protein